MKWNNNERRLVSREKKNLGWEKTLKMIGTWAERRFMMTTSNLLHWWNKLCSHTNMIQRSALPIHLVVIGCLLFSQSLGSRNGTPCQTKALNSHWGLQFQDWTSDAFSIQEELVMMPQMACSTQRREKAKSEVHVNWEDLLVYHNKQKPWVPYPT